MAKKQSHRKRTQTSVPPPASSPQQAPQASHPPQASQAPQASPPPRPPAPSAAGGTAVRILAAAPPIRQTWPILVLMAVLFLAICFTVSDTIKVVALLMLIAAIGAVIFRLKVLGERLSLPFAAVTLWVLLCGISTLYAVSGKFALSEFLKLLVAYCLFLLFLAFGEKGASRGRGIASILEACAALAGLFSIDLLSTRLLSTPLISFLSLFSINFSQLAGVEVGSRMTSLFTNPNNFAGFVGLGVLLSLGLANSAPSRGERRFHLVCLFLNALSFVLAFSMGATGMICAAFLIFLLLERGDRRTSLLILMLETLILTLLATVPVFLTGFDAWSGIQPVPLLCTVAGAALLCLVDRFAGEKLTALLQGRGKLVLGLVLVLVAALGLFAALAVNLTGGVSLEAGSSLRRADYPEPGTYTLETTASGPLQVTIESQNQQDTMMHTSTVLYRGPAEGAAFTVPEDSLVVYFDFRAGEAVRLDAAAYQGETGGGSLKLGYKLLPGFIANRLQGLFANQNAIQRTVFFADGLKLFRRSPVFGLGMGAFESAICSVQSFFYETKYAHNHYIQSLVEEGVLGLLLFLAVLILSAAAVLRNLRREDASPLTAPLGACLAFMAGHAAVELVFSNCFYLPMALGVLALINLCCGHTLPLPALPEKAKTGVPLGVAGLLAVFLVLLGCNLQARNLFDHVNDSSDPYGDLKTAIALDRFEWVDYMLSYVYSARGEPEGSALRNQADQYAERLSKVDSNTVPLYLTEYYFTCGDQTRGFEMAEKYAAYVSSNPKTWDSMFRVVAQYAEDSPRYREGLARLYQMLLDWNEQNMGSITLAEDIQAFVESMA